MTFAQFLKRLRDDGTTLYVVTRPPEEDWHRVALTQLIDTRVANVVLVPSLHTKLYYADTAQGSFALIGSANFTQRSLDNREIAVMIRGVSGGAKIVRALSYEAAMIYRFPGATPISRKQL